MRTITYEELREELRAKYKKPENWRFRCPDCNNIQSVNDFLEAGHNPNDTNLKCLECYLVLTPSSKTHTLEIIINANGDKQPSFEIA
jgi:transcription elongation factor Elf1